MEAIKLRGHHLICLHFFRGEGYDPLFTDNLAEVVRRAEEGEDVLIISGADDVCRKCPHLKNERCSHSENSEDEIRDMDAKALTLLNLKPGATVKWPELKKSLPVILKEWESSFCAGCSWKGTCFRQ